MACSTASSSRSSSARARSAAVSGASDAKSSASMISVVRIRLLSVPPIEPQRREDLALTHREHVLLGELEPGQQGHDGVEPVAERRDEAPELDARHAAQRLHDQPDLLLERD